ncbi:MAG TPA: hypothetical protein VFW83_05420 [Bryobacteraceae bacterium]|nr:hypothetical protein [Bryobacteraceae bacterium]
MIRRVLFPTVFAILFLASCAKQAGGGQHATVEMRDGTEVSGTVLSSSAQEIQIAGDDKVTRTIPMSQVRSIEYDEAAPAEPAAAASGANPASNANPAAAPAAKQAPPPRHRDYHAPASAVTSTTHEVPSGTEISVRNEETIDSGKTVEGQTYPAETTADVLDVSGKVVIPRGSNARIVIRSASKGGKIRGASDLVMDLASISIDGQLYKISTADMSRQGNSGVGANRRTGEFAGGGAAIGAIIGAIAGGGKGAAIGAGSGAGAGAVAQILTKGTIKVPVETILTFKLDKPLRVTAAK